MPKGEDFMPKMVGEYRIPSYALTYLFYGDTDGLTDEDLKNIDGFLNREGLMGAIPSEVEESHNEFDTNPAFGLACDTYLIRFYK